MPDSLIVVTLHGVSYPVKKLTLKDWEQSVLRVSPTVRGNLIAAVEEHQRRKNPGWWEGIFHRVNGDGFVSVPPVERETCCVGIREPMLLQHVCGIKHLAWKYQVSTNLLKKAVKLYEAGVLAQLANVEEVV